MTSQSFMQDIVFNPDQEVTDIMLEHKQVRIERIVSAGQTSDWYDQSEDEWVMLLEGEAELEIETSGTVERVKLAAHDTVWLPAHTRHRVARTSAQCVWFCLFIAGPVRMSED